MNVPDLIAQSKQDIEKAKTQLLKTFAFVPDDKLHWSPAPTARTSLQIVAHCGAANRVLAALIRGEDWPLSSEPKEAAAQIRDGGKEITTREAAIKLVEDSTQEALEALAQVTAERMETVPSTPLGSPPFLVWMQSPAMHMGGHVPQIDYLQTIWGDQQAH